MTGAATGSSRARLAAALWVAIILSGTLFPDYSTRGYPPPLCLTCGYHASVDVILNILLFLPLGATLAWARWRGLRAIGGAALLSLAIETTQFIVPGRDPSLRDVLSNTLGATLGWSIVASMRYWLLPGRDVAARLCLAAAAAVALVFAATGVLLHPASVVQFVSAEWAEETQTMKWYHATVLDTRIGAMELPHGHYPDPQAFYARLLAGQPLVIRAVAGPPVPAFGPLLGLYDRWHALVEIGPDRQDLVLRYRPRAKRAGFDSPSFRLKDALAGVRSGDSLDVVVRVEPGRLGMAVNGRATTVELTVADGWTLVFAAPYRNPLARRLLSFVWLALLLLPVGYWSRGRALILFGALVVLVAGGVGAWLAGGLRLPTAWELTGAVVGLLAGWALERVATLWAGSTSRAAARPRRA